jgi:hypothetical protein
MAYLLPNVDRREIEMDWLRQVEVAKDRYGLAVERVRQLIEADSMPSDDHSDGLRIQQAREEAAEARHDYIKALDAFAGIVIHGKQSRG